MSPVAPVAFDLDGVLLDVMPCVQKHLNDLYGDAGDLQDNGRFRMETVGGHSKTEIRKAIDRMYCDLSGVEPEEGASAILNHLFLKHGKPIRVITARPHRCQMETEMALDRFFPGVEFDLRMAPGKSKHWFLNSVDSFVEDRRRNAVSVAGRGIQVFLIDRPYNQMGPVAGITRVKDCYELFKWVG